MGDETERLLEPSRPLVTTSDTSSPLSLIRHCNQTGWDLPGPVEAIFQISKTPSGLVFPRGLSFFHSHLEHFVKESLEIGGEAYVSKDPNGAVSGLFIYDNDEKSGTVFTQSEQVFEYFYARKPFESLFAEIKVGPACEPYDIYSINLDGQPVDHRFSHTVSIEEVDSGDEIKQFMAFTHPGSNKNWVDVALNNGEKCFTVRLEDGIAGLGWATSVNRIGRLHTLFVKPQFRRLGIGEDLAFARLLWLKSKGSHSAFSEIAKENGASSRIAVKAQMKVSGELFQYFKRESEKRV
jgi:GNAT superfamily N-acetyltransferase